MKKKLPQSAVVTANAISFAAAAIFGGIGIFAAIANFTRGGWDFMPATIGSLIPGMGTAFFMAFLGLICGLIAMFTLKKITDADLLKKSYATVGVVAGAATVAMIAYLVGIMIYAILAVGAGGDAQAMLWLDCFLPALITGGLFLGLALIAKQIASGGIKILPTMTIVVLCVASAGALLTIISTLVGLYAKSGSYDYDYDDVNNFLNLFR